MKALLEIIATYGSENDNQTYWDRLAQTYSEDQVIQGILSSFAGDDADVIFCTCVFVQHTTAHFPAVIETREIIKKIEETAAGHDLRNAHVAVFVLGRIGSRESVNVLKSILVTGKHEDPDFVQNLEVNIEMLSQ